MRVHDTLCDFVRTLEIANEEVSEVVELGGHGSNDRGVMGAGFFKLDEYRGGCCQLGRGEEVNSTNRVELGAACLALEDTKRQQDRKPVILLSDSACFLSPSPRRTGEGKSPNYFPLLQERRKRSGKNPGRGNSKSTTYGH